MFALKHHGRDPDTGDMKRTAILAAVFVLSLPAAASAVPTTAPQLVAPANRATFSPSTGAMQPMQFEVHGDPGQGWMTVTVSTHPDTTPSGRLPTDIGVPGEGPLDLVTLHESQLRPGVYLGQSRIVYGQYGDGALYWQADYTMSPTSPSAVWPFVVLNQDPPDCASARRAVATLRANIRAARRRTHAKSRKVRRAAKRTLARLLTSNGPVIPPGC